MKLKYDKEYGVTKVADRKFHARFWNPIEKNDEYIKSCVSEELANIAYSNYQFEFYSKYPFILPKGVSVNRRNKGFKYAVTLDSKTYFNKNFDTVQKCLKYRDSILKAMI